MISLTVRKSGANKSKFENYAYISDFAIIRSVRQAKEQKSPSKLLERNSGDVHSVLDNETEHCRYRSSEQENSGKYCSIALQLLYHSQMEQRSLAPGQERF